MREWHIPVTEREAARHARADRRDILLLDNARAVHGRSRHARRGDSRVIAGRFS